MTSEGVKDIKIPHLYIYLDAATSCKESIRLESRKRQAGFNTRKDQTMKKYIPELQKILTDIGEAEEKDRKADEERNFFVERMSVENWKEDKYQELTKRKIFTEAAYMAKLLELRIYVRFIVNQELKKGESVCQEQEH